MLGPDACESDVLLWAGVSSSPGASIRRLFAPEPLWMPRLRSEHAVTGWKRISLEADPVGRLSVAGVFSGVRVGFDALAVCDEHRHPRGIVDPQIPCYDGFSAHAERLSALEYEPSDGPLAVVRLSGNVALTGTPASWIDYCGERQSVVSLELVAACTQCGGNDPHRHGVRHPEH